MDQRVHTGPAILVSFVLVEASSRRNQGGLTSSSHALKEHLGARVVARTRRGAFHALSGLRITRSMSVMSDQPQNSNFHGGAMHRTDESGSSADLQHDTSSGGSAMALQDACVDPARQSTFSAFSNPPWKHSVDCRATLCDTRRSVPDCSHRKRIVFPAPLHFGELPELEPAQSNHGSKTTSDAPRNEPFSSKGAVQRLNHAIIGASEELIPHVVYDDVGDVPGRLPSDLEFESKFESGNLQRSIRIGQLQYDLVLRPDLGTGGCQWYYFMVRNMRKGERYRFNIVNLYKEKSMYRRGLLPLLWSEKEAMTESKGWRRAGRIIGYDENRVKRKGGGYHYTLSFQIEFPCDDDCCFLAMCYPYTYTDLHHFLENIIAKEGSGDYMQRTQLCATPCGYSCDMLVITASAPESVVASRKAFLITGRVHPGESNSSWVVQGMIKFLTGSSPLAQALRDVFVFYIVPMINPGGVIHGYYRVSNTGFDLNRQWIDPKEATQATIYHCKKLVQALSGQRRLLMFCDVHGHSSKPNAFMYGCNSAAFGTSLFGQMDMHRESLRREHAFPRRFSELSPALSFKDCKFQIDKTKESTGRGVVFKEFAVVHSYTLEASFLGPDQAPSTTPDAPQLTHFNTAHLETLGVDFMLTVADYAAGGASGWEIPADQLKTLSLALRVHRADHHPPHPPASQPRPASSESCGDAGSAASDGPATLSDGPATPRRHPTPPRVMPPPQSAPSSSSQRRPPSHKPPLPPSAHRASTEQPPADAALAEDGGGRKSPRALVERAAAHARRRAFRRREPIPSPEPDAEEAAGEALQHLVVPATLRSRPRRHGFGADGAGGVAACVRTSRLQRPPADPEHPAPRPRLRSADKGASPGEAPGGAGAGQEGGAGRTWGGRPRVRAKSAAAGSVRLGGFVPATEGGGQPEMGGEMSPGSWIRVLQAPVHSPREGLRAPQRHSVVEREVAVYGGRGRLKFGRPATALLVGGARTLERVTSLRGGVLPAQALGEGQGGLLAALPSRPHAPGPARPMSARARSARAS